MALSAKEYRAVVREVKKYVPDIKIKIDDLDIIQDMMEPGTQAAFCHQDQMIITREPEYYRSKRMLRHVLFHELGHWATKQGRAGKVRKFNSSMLKKKVRKHRKDILFRINHALEEMIVDSVSYYFCVKSGDSYNTRSHENYVHTWAKRGGLTHLWTEELELYFDKKVKKIIHYIESYRKEYDK